jgi:hypothetical protein
MVPFLHVCPDYRMSKRHPSSRRRQGGRAGASGSGDGWRVAADDKAALLLPEAGFIMARANIRPRPSSPNSRNGGASCPGTSKLSTSLMEDSALGSEDRPANFWPCQSPFRRSGRRRPASVSLGRLPGPASSGTCPQGTAGSRSGEGSGSFGPNPVAPRLANPGRRRQILRFTAQPLPGRLCNEPVPAAGIPSPDASRWSRAAATQAGEERSLYSRAVPAYRK